MKAKLEDGREVKLVQLHSYYLGGTVYTIEEIPPMPEIQKGDLIQVIEYPREWLLVVSVVPFIYYEKEGRVEQVDRGEITAIRPKSSEWRRG